MIKKTAYKTSKTYKFMFACASILYLYGLCKGNDVLMSAGAVMIFLVILLDEILKAIHSKN